MHFVAMPMNSFVKGGREAITKKEIQNIRLVSIEHKI
jgi:hypothetical protein